MREKTSKRGMPRRAAGPGKGEGRPAGPPGAAPAGRPKAAGPGEAGAPCGPWACGLRELGERMTAESGEAVQTFDRRGKLR